MAVVVAVHRVRTQRPHLAVAAISTTVDMVLLYEGVCYAVRVRSPHYVELCTLLVAGHQDHEHALHLGLQVPC